MSPAQCAGVGSRVADRVSLFVGALAAVLQRPTQRSYAAALTGLGGGSQTMMLRLRNRGINLLGARNSALRNLVAEIPPPVVAHLLGYSNNCTQRHAQLAAQPWSRYATR